MKKNIFLAILAVQMLQNCFSQNNNNQLYLKLNRKKHEGFLPRREVLNDIIPVNEINGKNFLFIEDYFSIDSNTMVFQGVKNAKFADFSFSVVEKDKNTYKASQYNMNRMLVKGTRGFVKINEKIHRFRSEMKNNQTLFFADELQEDKIDNSKMPFHTEDAGEYGMVGEQIFNLDDKLLFIYSSFENKKWKMNILTFSNSDLKLLNKKQFELSGFISRFEVIKNNGNINLYLENIEGEKYTGSLFKIDKEGNYSQIGNDISLEGETDRAYYYKNNGQLFLCRYSLNVDESWTNTIFEAGNSFNLLNKTKIPVETIYKGYFEKSFKEVNTKVFIMYNFGFHDILKDAENNTYIAEYRIKQGEKGENGSTFYAVCDIFLTKINSNNEIVFSTPIKRSLRSTASGELFPTFEFTKDEITFEDLELEKCFEDGVYKENYNFRQFGILKKDPLKIKVSINQENGEITRTILN